MEDLQGGTFSRRNPKGDSEQKIGCAEEIPCSDHIEMSRFCIRREPRHGQGKDEPVMMSPQPANCGNGPASRPSPASNRNKIAIGHSRHPHNDPDISLLIATFACLVH